MMSKTQPLTSSHSAVISEFLLGDSLRIELEPCPPDYVQKISQYLASPAGQKGPEDPGEADSDSGDSLFLTQRCVPEPVRTRRKRAPDFMSDFRSDGNPEFYEDQTSSSVSDEDPKLVKKKWKRKTYRLPKYRFSFLSKTRKQGGGVLPSIQNKKLHNYAMGGFFGCVQEMWEGCRKGESQMSSLPTVDMDGESISPISEEEEEGKEESLEDGDFKVVRKKQLVVSLKPKRSQPWYTPKESDVRQQKSTPGNAGCVSEGRQQSAICKVPAWAPLRRITLRSDTDNSDDGDGRVQAETPKPQICLELGRENTVCHQKENAEQLGDNSGAPVRGPSPKKRSRKVAKAAVTEPHADAGWEPESQNLPKGDAENVILCSEARVKQRRKKKGKGNYESVLGGNGQSGEEAERQHAAADVSEATAAEEASRPSQVVNEPSKSDSKGKKKKKTCTADDIRAELEGECNEMVGGHSVVSFNVENGGKKKKKDVNDREGQSDSGEMKKERKRKKALNETSDVPQRTTEHSEENAQETSESSTVKRKKLKKKLSACNNGIQFEEDARVEVDRSSDVITVTDFEAHVSGVPEEDEDIGNTKKITEVLEEQDCELVTKKRKKKKKMREKSKSEDSIAQSDYLSSEWKNGKERTSSFLVADGEKEAGETLGGNHTPRDRGAEKPDISTGHSASESADITERLNRSKYGLKKKKKRKRSAAEEGVERERDFEEQDKTSPGAVSEAWLREKKKRKRSNSVMNPVEGWETAAGVGHCQTGEVVVFRTKAKKKKKLKAATEDAESEKSSLNAHSSLSPKKKCKRGHSTETLAHISSPHERETREREISSSQSSQKKHKKEKRRLHNPNEDFLTQL